MTPVRFQTIEEIFHSARNRSADQIGAFLDEACAGDADLRSEVEALLTSRQRASTFIETPAIHLAATILKRASADSHVGQRIGHYELGEQIGAGGMGEVYLATDVTSGRKAALKFLPLRFTHDAARVQRFEQEARALVALNHPNIVTAYEIGEDRSTHFIASELIEGETLRQRLTRGPLPAELAIDVAMQAASALAAAHEAGIIHRDIKPENIMLRPDGYVKVLDFGIAKLAGQESPAAMTEDGDAASSLETRVTSIAGTARYMSPEQARGGSVVKATDIWSLGVVLYEILAGRAPFGGERANEVLTSILETEPPLLPSGLTELQQIVTRTLRKEPNERYASAHQLIEALKAVRRRMELTAESGSSARTPPSFWPRWAAALVLVLLGAALGLRFYWTRSLQPELPPSEKSIAVLPFQNLSKDPENAFFADGVQDEILSSLAKVGDLKVISRTSVMSYKGSSQRNLREIGQQLGVANVLEGTVQRTADRVRVNAQLIDARTDTHLWAQTYDRDVADLFAIQSEIAQTIADQLQVMLSLGEKAAIAQAPTNDLVANELYQKAIALEAHGGGNLLEAIKLLEQAVGRDPQFVRAHNALARLHLFLYEGEDHTPSRLRAAEASIENASQIQPDAGEVHLIRAHYLSRALRDYDRARAELELARRSLPNDPWVYHEAALMDRRQGRWAEAQQNYAHAIELDPRNSLILVNAAATCSRARRYAEAIRLAQRALALAPADDWARIFIAWQALHERAEPALLRSELENALARDRGAASNYAADLFECAMYQRDAAEAERALALIPPAGHPLYFGCVVPREWYAGYLARVFHRPEAARTAFLAAKAILENQLRERPESGLTWSMLGEVNAALGEKEEAVAAGRRACEIWPVSKEPYWGLGARRRLAMIYAWVGEKDLALEQLAAYLDQPSFIHYGDLKDPRWDSLRGDRRFERIVASLAPSARPGNR